jgi:CHAT domain-containing protein/tetratricopeptide (TPR) repeat protein
LTLPQVDNDILKYQCLLASSPRSDPDRPAHLLHLAVLRTKRHSWSHQKGDLDKAITHLTEAVLLPFQPSRAVVHMFFQLATVLLLRFQHQGYEQPEDVKFSLKYLRYLRINFHPLEAFDISHDQLTLHLVQALARNLISGSDDMMQDLEEIAAFSHELLSSDVSMSDLISPISNFSAAVVMTTFDLEDAKLPPEQVIQVMREAEMIIPDSTVSFALACCLFNRFRAAHVINDYEDAIAITDKILAAHSPGDSLTATQINAIHLIKVLVVSRLTSYLIPEYLEDAIHRLRSLLSLPSLPDRDRSQLTVLLDNYVRERFRYFDATGNSGETPSNTIRERIFWVSLRRQAPFHWDVGTEDNTTSQTLEKVDCLREILITMSNDEITDVEAAVEHSRTLLPSQHSSHRSSYFPAIHFAHILRKAHQRTNRLDYLNEAITAYRDLRKLTALSAPKAVHFTVGHGLLQSVIARLDLFHLRQDLEEEMQLFAELANDGSAEVFLRFKISCGWAHNARLFAHPSISTAYETTMSLLQETLVFAPTLQTQHFRLANALRKQGVFPSEYASYQIEMGQIKQAIETLERGRALLWSEMRGLRTSIDQLRAADPTLADRLMAINRDLEMVTMSVAQLESENTDIVDGEAGNHEGMDAFGRLFLRQRSLSEERDSLITHVKSFPGFEDFLKPPSFDVLNSAAAHGPVVIINQCQFRSYIIILLKDSPPSVISTPSNFHDRANWLKDELLRLRKEKGLDNEDYDLTLASVLADLYELVGKPVIGRLRQLEVPEKSRVWLCPTSALCSLPLHAMGPIPSDDGKELYFLDLYITSYTPTLSALIESRKSGSQPKTLDKPSLLLVAQPETLPGAWDEINVLKAIGSPVTTLVSEQATSTTVVASLRGHQFVHFVCHGFLETGKPFDASFELHGDNLTLLEIVRSQLPAAEFAFLSACHTAELTEDSIADEGLHLTAAMQYCGFRSVVGTMWAMADTDGADLSKHFYRPIFSESTGRRRVPYYERSARALQSAVKKLRKKRGVTLERWVNFVHYGA